MSSVGVFLLLLRTLRGGRQRRGEGEHLGKLVVIMKHKYKFPEHPNGMVWFNELLRQGMGVTIAPGYYVYLLLLNQTSFET